MLIYKCPNYLFQHKIYFECRNLKNLHSKNNLCQFGKYLESKCLLIKVTLLWLMIASKTVFNYRACKQNIAVDCIQGYWNQSINIEFADKQLWYDRTKKDIKRFSHIIFFALYNIAFFCNERPLYPCQISSKFYIIHHVRYSTRLFYIIFIWTLKNCSDLFYTITKIKSISI